MQATQQLFSDAPATIPGTADLFFALDIRRRLVFPAERLNNKHYVDAWFVNLVVSASMNGTVQSPL